MVIKDPKQSPKISAKISAKQTLNQAENNDDGNNSGSLLSPRFKSVAAMAGWDEEALLLASLVVEDTPDRNNSKHKKRSDFNFNNTPPSNSRRKRRAQRRSAASIPVAVLNLDDDESTGNKEGVDEKKKAELQNVKNDVPEKVERDEKEPSGSGSCSSSSTLACMDRLREELSCAICLEICFEPSTTPCGHSFCKKCLRSAADKCGKRCPKCRQLISNGRSCTVNTVLWNTIQLLFPEEVKARKEAGALNSREAERQSPERRSHHQSSSDSNHQYVSRRVRPEIARRAEVTFRSRRAVPSQDEDAAFALRLQREEFMEMYRGRSSLARDNLRAMAQRAINNRMRTRPV